jgi:predicted Fe-S protein YdhL (DUF1289 family)
MVPSPCKNVCRMDETSGLCAGCGRTLDEIALWSVLDDDDKRTVWALLPERLARLPPDLQNLSPKP